MSRPISKTNFLDFLFCPKNLWLKLNKPELLELFELSDYEKHLAEEGNEVEAYARGLFPGGIEAALRGEDGRRETAELVAGKAPVIFQATFIADGFLARCDVLKRTADGRFELYEIKGTSAVHDGSSNRSHIDDLAFQKSVLRRAGTETAHCLVLHLNTEYVRGKELSLAELFLTEDVSEKVEERMAFVEARMGAAKEYLGEAAEPRGGCECIYKGRSAQCTTFRYSNPEVPGYSVHDLARIGASKKKLQGLVERRIFDLADVPRENDLSDAQKNQITSYVKNSPLIDVEAVRQELEDLIFPLYFIDYETFAPAIPLFCGYRPFDKVPFQFSLHIVRRSGDEPTHHEYLHPDITDPSRAVTTLLSTLIGREGTIIAWNKSFEMDVHRKLAERLPEHRPFLKRTLEMFYDLQDMFHKQYYVHPAFKGSTSIKYVLPALVPELQYRELTIRGGAQASDAWWQMVAPGTPPEKSEQIARDLKTYCRLDTYAMYAIWRHVMEMVAANSPATLLPLHR